MANNVTFKTGEIIFREGAVPTALYIIRTGRVRISRGNAVLDELGANAFFGEMALIDQAPRCATATALEDTECVEVPASDFHKRVNNLDPVMHGIFRVLVERIRLLDRRLAKDQNDIY